MFVFFGILHQGGVIPSLAYVQQESNNNPPVFNGFDVDDEYGLDVIYFKTFMPPRFLVAQPRKGQYPVRIHDPGRSETKLFDALEEIESKYCVSNLDTHLHTIIISPSLASFPNFNDEFHISQEPLKTFWPHFSSEDPPTSFHDFWFGSLNLYSIQFVCKNK